MSLQNSPSTVVEAQGQVPSGARQLYIDNLRWLMIILVVVMHACVTYSGLGSWYYKEPSPVGITGMLVFAFYQSFTQAYFMGLLFFIAGVFVPRAYDRKGAARFIRDRLIRLGVPSLVFMLLISPLTWYVIQRAQGRLVTMATLGALYRGEITSLRIFGDTGPLWFAVALLVFSILYALARRGIEALPRRPETGNRNGARGREIGSAMVAGMIVVIGAGTFLVRTVQPIGTSWMNMQLCYFTQYVVLFLAGLWVGRHRLLDSIPARFGTSWLKLSLAAGIPAWFLIGGLGGAASGSMESFVAAMAGGWNWQAAAMAMWESFFCVSFVIGLVVLYRDRYNTRGRLSSFLSANAFGVYVFHTPILVAISLLLRQLSLTALPKTAVVMSIAVAASFLFAALVRLAPPFRRLFS